MSLSFLLIGASAKAAQVMVVNQNIVGPGMGEACAKERIQVDNRVAATGLPIGRTTHVQRMGPGPFFRCVTRFFFNPGLVNIVRRPVNQCDPNNDLSIIYYDSGVNGGSCLSAYRR